MGSQDKAGPYTIPIDNGPPPPYGMIAESYKPSKDAEFNVQKPTAQQQSTSNNTSTIISLPEIIENEDDQNALVANMIFDLKTIRQAFIKKVFGLVFMMLMITALVTYGLLQCHNYLLFAGENAGLVIGISFSCYFTTFLAMMCFTDARRKVPYNYIFLLLFTLSLSILIPVAIQMMPFEQILFAAGSTFLIVAALTLFAFQTKIDFTLLSGSCLCLVLPLIMLGIAVLTTNWDGMRLFYTTLGVIIICVYIVWDVQLIIGGEHRYGFSPEEYVFAALVLYVDIMYLFLKLLRYAR